MLQYQRGEFCIRICLGCTSHLGRMEARLARYADLEKKLNERRG